MPVIVKELVLTVKTETSPPATGQREQRVRSTPAPDAQLVREAVEEALRIVNNKKER